MARGISSAVPWHTGEIRSDIHDRGAAEIVASPVGWSYPKRYNKHLKVIKLIEKDFQQRQDARKQVISSKNSRSDMQ